MEPHLSACKALPYGNHEMLVAVVAAGKEEGTVDLVLGVADPRSRKVLATRHDVVVEDAGFRFDTDSLRWDTANYQLATGVRAFGLGIRSGYIPHCADSDDGEQRTLYVWQGDQLRPVTPPLPLYRAVYVVQASGTRCSMPSDKPVQSVTEVYTSVVELGPEASNGWKDLNLRVTRRHLERPSRPKAERTATLRYDGQQYRFVPAQPDDFTLDTLFAR